MQRSYTPSGFECSGFSCTGAIRESNADGFLMADICHPFDAVRHLSQDEEPLTIHSNSTGQLLIVADGIGGGNGGVFASQLVVEMAHEHLCLQSGREADNQTVVAGLTEMLRRSQRNMRQEAERDGSGPIGTTVTAACVLGSTLHLLHAGDSRCYLIRDGEPHLLTTDHNLAQRLVEDRILDADLARKSRLRHVLWNAITAECELFTLETASRQLRPGDLLLLCTDGLTKHLTDADILAIADRPDPTAIITRRLVDTALADGGSDNITVVVARYQGRTVDASSSQGQGQRAASSRSIS